MDTREQSVADTLRHMIMNRTLEPGERVREIALSARLGVSRTPIRLALTALAQEGLLIHRPNRGFVVRSVSLGDVLDAYQVRATLEGLGCRLAAEVGISPEAAHAIEASLVEGDRILTRGRLLEEDSDAWRQMNEVFHQTILRSTSNRSLIDAAGRLLALPLLSARVIHWQEFEAIQNSHYIHHAIYDRIRIGQGARAEALMIEHLLIARDIIRENFSAMSTAPEPVGLLALTG